MENGLFLHSDAKGHGTHYAFFVPREAPTSMDVLHASCTTA